MPVIKVRLGGSLTGAAGGLTVFEVEAGTIHQILARLGSDYPELQQTIDDGVSVAIDGVVYQGDFTRAVPPGSEVFLLPPLVGG